MSHHLGQVKAEAEAIAAALAEEVVGGPDAYVAAMRDLEDAIGVLRIAKADMEERALARWPAERWATVHVPHVGVFVKGTRNDTVTWDHRGAALAVARAGLDRELVHHPNDVADLLISAGALAYWRVKTLRSLDVDPNDYREVVKGTPCVHLTS